MIYIHYWLLFFKNGNFKYTTVSQRLTFISFSLFHIFLSNSFLSYYRFSNSHAKRNITSVIYIAYFENFCYVMYYIMPEICIGAYFLEGYFYCYSQQIKSALGNESLILHSLIKRGQYFLGRKLLFIDLKLGTHTKLLENVQRRNKTYISNFSRWLNFYFFLLDCKLSLCFFFVFRLFASFNVFLWEHFALAFIMKYFTSSWFERG